MTCGSLEIDILNSIWSLTSGDDDNDISIQDVVDDLSSRNVERAYTTIKTVMDRLVAKSILVRYRVGKKFFYKTTMTKEEMASEAVDEIVENFFNGSSSELMHFVESKYSLTVA